MMGKIFYQWQQENESPMACMIRDKIKGGSMLESTMTLPLSDFRLPFPTGNE